MHPAAGGPGHGYFHYPRMDPSKSFVALEVAGMDELSITLDGEAIHAAAERANVIWT